MKHSLLRSNLPALGKGKYRFTSPISISVKQDRPSSWRYLLGVGPFDSQTEQKDLVHGGRLPACVYHSLSDLVHRGGAEVISCRKDPDTPPCGAWSADNQEAMSCLQEYSELDVLDFVGGKDQGRYADGQGWYLPSISASIFRHDVK